MSEANIHAEPLPLTLRSPFRIAHGTSTTRTNVLVMLSADGLTGYGEAALPPYYPTTIEDVRVYVQAIRSSDLLGDDPLALHAALDRLPEGPMPARAALDMALHDLWAKRLGHPLYRLWGLRLEDAPLSSHTLAIPDDLAALPEQIGGLRSPILKLKLGAGSIEQDEAIVAAARAAHAGPLCVDANSAWTVDEAAELIPRLQAYHLAFIEQPIAGEDLDDWHVLRRRLPRDIPPLIADESLQSLDDIIVLAGAADGINIKLAKAGGLRMARRQIELARALDMQVMLGCMVESAVAVTAAVHLAPLVDYADLDAPLLLAHDPFDGVRWDCGRLTLPQGNGIGVRRSGAC